MRWFLCLAVTAAPLSAATCESLSSLKLTATSITAAQTVSPGSFTAPSAPQGGQAAFPYKNLPAFCRVQGVIKPSEDSHIEFEVWLPAAGWNNRYEGIGNGGFAGSIDYGALADAVGNGYAASATDTGHKAAVVDGRWALGHPEKVTDFGYRAIHATAENAKAIIAAFYGGRPRHSYFSSCSNGGRQALMEAQRYPSDYDGILAGAPANYWTHLLANAASEDTFLNDGASRIPASKVAAIQAATLAACDADDGAKDGIINNPPSCQFDPAELLCKGAESDACLTAAQVQSLAKLYAGSHDGSGKPIFPGRLPGGEGGTNGWALWITGYTQGASLMHAFSTGFFSNMLFGNSAWDYRTFQLDRDTKLADDELAFTLNATDPDLRRFEERGGKLIVYHGWNDPAISPLNSIDYFRAVQEKLGGKTRDAFMRLYLVPGMQHCSGGPGPDSFGQDRVDAADPQHSISKALERWVEDGEAPNQIVATRYKAGTDPAAGVVRTRPLCPYPQVLQYSGAGNTDEAQNFRCVASR